MEFSQRTSGRLLLVSLASLAYSCYQEAFSGFSGAAVVNASYFTFSTPSLLFCARRCRLQRKCLSFNFDVNNGECYLNLRSQVTPGTELQGGSPLQSFDISLWSEVRIFLIPLTVISSIMVLSPISYNKWWTVNTWMYNTEKDELIKILENKNKRCKTSIQKPNKFICSVLYSKFRLVRTRIKWILGYSEVFFSPR